jgi:hypothetical protein
MRFHGGTAENKERYVNDSEKILFSEVQRFSLLLIMPLVLFFLVAIALEGHMVFRPSIEMEDPWSTWTVPISIAGIMINVFVTFILLFANLQTRLSESALYIRFFPFHFSYRKIDFDTIATVYARSYQPLGEFGGWGIRWTPRGRAYNVSGNQGVQLELKNGKRILIGSLRADELASLLNETMFHARLSSYPHEQNDQMGTANPSREQAG